MTERRTPNSRSAFRAGDVRRIRPESERRNVGATLAASKQIKKQNIVCLGRLSVTNALPFCLQGFIGEKEKRICRRCSGYNKENNLNASSHHIVQDATVNSLPKYDRDKAPAISLDDKYGTKDSAHYNASEVQRNATTSDLGNEKSIGREALEAADVPEDVIAEAENNVDDYFSNIGANDSDCVNKPKNRK